MAHDGAIMIVGWSQTSGGFAGVTEFRRIHEQALIAAVVAHAEARFFAIVRLPIVAGSAGERVVDAVDSATRQSFYSYGHYARGSFHTRLSAEIQPSAAARRARQAVWRR